MPSARRFPPPRIVDEHRESFIVRDANGQALGYFYFEDEPQRQMSMKRLTRDEALRMASGVVRGLTVVRSALSLYNPELFARLCRLIEPPCQLGEGTVKLIGFAQALIVVDALGFLKSVAPQMPG